MWNSLLFNVITKFFRPLVATAIIILISFNNNGLAQEGSGPELTPIEVPPSPIDVSIDLKPFQRDGNDIYVAVNTDLNISAVIEFPDLYSKQLNYKWSTKEGIVKSKPTDDAITYKFTKSDETNFVQVDVQDPVNNVSGSSKFSLTVNTPVKVLDPSGKLFLERGELLNISLRYTGSPPFRYCYKFCQPFSILPCDLCFQFYDTSDYSIPIIKYLPSVGSYTLMLQIQNRLNYEQKYYVIKINDAIRGSNLPIAPIVSTILAVLIIISGVALHIKFRDSSYATETANFDFLNDNEEEWEQEFSLIQRIRYLFCSNEPDDSDEVTHLLQKDTPQMNGYINGNNKTT